MKPVCRSLCFVLLLSTIAVGTSHDARAQCTSNQSFENPVVSSTCNFWQTSTAGTAILGQDVTTGTPSGAAGLEGTSLSGSGVLGMNAGGGGNGVVGLAGTSAIPSLTGYGSYAGLVGAGSGTGMNGVYGVSSGDATGVVGGSTTSSGVGIQAYNSAGGNALAAFVGGGNQNVIVAVDPDGTTGAYAGVWGSSVSPEGWGVKGSNTATGGAGLYGLASTGVGVLALSGGATQPAVYAAVVGAYAGSGGYGGYFTSNTSQAVHGEATSTSGQDAIYGITSATSGERAGVKGESGESTGYGVAGVNTGSGDGVFGTSATGYGVYAQSAGPALYATTTGAGETAIQGNATSSSDVTVGVAGNCSSPTGYGVQGVNTVGTAIYGLGTSSTGGYRGIGISANAAGTASFGVNASTTGTDGGSAAINATSGGGSSWAGYFNGKVGVSGEIIVGSCSGCSSDIKLKKDVKPLTGAIDQLLALKGVTFEWKSPEEHEGHTGTQTGFIAQDVQKLFPEWVKDDGYTAPDGQKYKTLDTRQIEALEVESIRTLKAKNDALEERLKALEDGHPIHASTGFNFGGTNVGLLGLAAAIAYAASRRKAVETRA